MRTAALAALFLAAAQPALAQNEQGPKVQIAIVADVSQSLQGFIKPALAEVREFVAEATTDADPNPEVALVFYGRQANEEQASEFTTEIDQALAQLGQVWGGELRGGTEGCGSALERAYELPGWSRNVADTRLILILGNESFQQGRPSGHDAIRFHQQEVDVDAGLEAAAIRRGEIYARLVVPIVVHTRYVGPKGEGLRAKDWRQVRNLTQIQAGATTKVVHLEGVADLPRQ